MCSILGILDIKTDSSALRKQALQMSKRQRHRGPDWSGIYANHRVILVHERLSIVDVQNGAQPLVSSDGKLALAVNGEIYNHRELEENLNQSFEFLTQSDCEVIMALYREKNTDFLNDLNGIFAFILFDEENGSYLIARDPIGVIPLYTGHDQHGNLYVASELKALTGHCNHIEEFPPGHYLDSRQGTKVRYYQRSWEKYDRITLNGSGKKELRRSLEDAVHRQLMSDVPYGVLLSGGLDSSIIAAIAKKFSHRRVESSDLQNAWWPRLHSFAIGLDGSPDLAAARIVADHIGSVHHEFHYTIDEGLDAVHDVIWHIETYDVTTVRASTPMYLLARRIRSMGVKMVLSGEGADEIFGGYLYFHKAPDARALHEETVRKLQQLHFYDCLRANKSMAAWGVEARVPFLDREFLDVAMNLDPELKLIKDGRQEKQILRDAFHDLLPDDVLRRQKEQFSDGVGYGWIDTLKKMAGDSISDKQMEAAAYRFPVNPPQSKEEYYYRQIFSEHFPSDSAAACVPSVPSVACSTPNALAWDKSLTEMLDPSGRSVLDVHEQSYDGK